MEDMHYRVSRENDYNFCRLAIAEWLVVNRLVQTCRFIYKYKGIVTTISNILALVVGFVEL